MPAQTDAAAATGATACWPCLLANTVVGLVVAWLPLAAVLVDGAAALVPLAVAWGVAVTAGTGYRLVTHGYLPFADAIAKRTGLHERVGPGAESETGADRDD